MTNFAYIVTQTVVLFLTVIDFMMLARIAVSLFADEESPLLIFLYYCTEPAVLPFRLILERSEAARELPIDMSFVAAVFFISFMRSSVQALI